MTHLYVIHLLQPLSVSDFLSRSHGILYKDFMVKIVFNKLFKICEVLGFVCDFFYKSKISLKPNMNLVCELRVENALWEKCP